MSPILEEGVVNKTVSQLLSNICGERGVQDCIVAPAENVKLAFIQLKNEVDQLASGLLAMGLAPGDRLLLWGANHTYLIVAGIACSKIGVVFSCMNPSMNEDGIKYCLNTGEFKCVICFPSIKAGHAYGLLVKICPELNKMASKGNLESTKLPYLKYVIVAEDEMKYGGTYTLNEIMSMSRPKFLEKIQEIEKNITPDSALIMPFTSGTTGDYLLPILSHKQFLTAGAIIAKRLYLDQPKEVLCCPMPIFRGPVFCIALGCVLVGGATLIFPSPLSLPPAIFKSVQDNKCTCLLSNPIAFHLMLRLPYVSDYDLSSITSACLVGEHVPSELIPAMQKRTNISDITVGMFHTETGCMPLIFPQTGIPAKALTTQGMPALPFQAKILNFEGKEKDTGKAGELWLKPIGQFLGYFKNKSNTEGRYVDGWISTGDIAFKDSDGYITIMGQKQDVIMHGPNNKPTFPWQIERRLQTHPMVIAVQVVGIDTEGGKSSKVCACVLLKGKAGEVEKLDTHTISQELIQLCRGEQLREPDHIVFVKDFPKTPTRKIQKFKVKQMAPSLVKQQSK